VGFLVAVTREPAPGDDPDVANRGLPTSVRHVNGYGSHTYSLINAAGERVWVKFHFKTQQGHRHWTNAQASTVIGRTRESTQEDLFGAIERGDFPKWRMQVQIMTTPRRRNGRSAPAGTRSTSPRSGHMATFR